MAKLNQKVVPESCIRIQKVQKQKKQNKEKAKAKATQKSKVQIRKSEIEKCNERSQPN